MCGIVGTDGCRDAIAFLEGLRSLEYRGLTDRPAWPLTTGTAGRSPRPWAGSRTSGTGSRVTKATVGIGHTRWATHGEPSDVNAHPHTDSAGRIAVVHNGIIENADKQLEHLTNRGVTLVSETDTEALAHMIAAEATDHIGLEEAVHRVLRRVKGTYGLIVLDREHPGELVVARNWVSPIVLGIGASEMFVASDVAGLGALHQAGGVPRRRRGGHGARRRLPDDLAGGSGPPHPRSQQGADHCGDRGLGLRARPVRRFHAQGNPRAARGPAPGRSAARLDDQFATARLGGINLDARQLRAIRQVKFLGCGSAYYAGQMGALLVEELARIPSYSEPASEFRYRNPVVDPDTLYVAVSQSGETTDTIMAVRNCAARAAKGPSGRLTWWAARLGGECGHGVFLHACRRSRSPPPRRLPAWRPRSPCLPCCWAESVTCPRRTASGWWPVCARCPGRSSRS